MIWPQGNEKHCFALCCPGWIKIREAKRESTQASQRYPVTKPLCVCSSTACYASAGFFKHLSTFLQHLKNLEKKKSWKAGEGNWCLLLFAIGLHYIDKEKSKKQSLSLYSSAHKTRTYHFAATATQSTTVGLESLQYCKFKGERKQLIMSILIVKNQRCSAGL